MAVVVIDHNRKLKDVFTSTITHWNQAQESRYRRGFRSPVFIEFVVILVDDIADLFQAAADVLSMFSDASFHMGGHRVRQYVVSKRVEWSKQ